MRTSLAGSYAGTVLHACEYLLPLGEAQEVWGRRVRRGVCDLASPKTGKVPRQNRPRRSARR